MDALTPEDWALERDYEDKLERATEVNPVKYPDVTVNLSDDDGNAFVIISKVAKALRRADVATDQIDAFRKEATIGDYDHLLTTCMAWVNVE